MARHIGSVALLVLLCMVGGAASVGAQTASGAPPPPIAVAPPPGGPPSPARGPALYDSSPIAFPHDFVFADRLFGSGFQPGEHVVIQAATVAMPAAQAVAANDGTFSVDVSYRWIFCGPGGSRQVPPVFSAQGDAGTQTSLARQPAPCPMLTTAPMAGAVVPGAGATGSPGTGTAVAGTAVAGTAVAVPQPSAPADPVSPSPPPAARQVSLILSGFGFAVDEHVSVQQVANGPFVPTQAVSDMADPQGRIQFPVQVELPARCATPSFQPELMATGDKGTSVIAPVIGRGTILIACPFRGPPSVGPGTPVPPGRPEPPLPGPDAAAIAAQIPLPILSLHTQAAARPGALQHASISTATPGTATLRILYSANKTVRLVIPFSTPGVRGVVWRAPRTTHHGTAYLRLAFAPGEVIVRSRMRVP